MPRVFQSAPLPAEWFVMIQVQLLPGTIGKCEVPSLHQLDTHMVLHVIHHLFTSKQYVQCVFEVVGGGS